MLSTSLPFNLVALLLLANPTPPTSLFGWAPSSALTFANAAPLRRIPVLADQDTIASYASKRSTIWSDEPIAPLELISYWPKIITPVEGQVLNEGSSFTLEWNSTLPPYPSNQYAQQAMLLLGYLSTESEGFHLDVNRPLGTNIPLYSGSNQYTFTVPTNLTTRTSYILILGSTGNTSPQFTILGTGPPDATAPTASSTYSGRTIEALPTTYIVGGETTVIGEPQPTMTPSAATPSTSSVASSTTTSPLVPGSDGVVAAGSTIVSSGTTAASTSPSTSPAPSASAVAGQSNSGATSSAVVSLQVQRCVVGFFALGLGLTFL